MAAFLSASSLDALESRARRAALRSGEDDAQPQH
jgi:hypothetical protein